MDKLTATNFFVEQLREMEFERIKIIIDGYSQPYKPETMNPIGEIFTFDSYDIGNKMFCDRYYVVTFVTKDKVYYKRLYAQIYHPTWESKQLSQNYDSTIYFNTYIKRTKYVFKYNKNLMNDLCALSLTIVEFNSNTTCFRSSEIYEIICDYDLIDIKLSALDKNNLKSIQTLIKEYKLKMKKIQY